LVDETLFSVRFPWDRLQRLEPRNRHHFADAFDLDFILRNSLGLNDLPLLDIRFKGCRPRASKHLARVEWFYADQNYTFNMPDVDDEIVMNGFTAVGSTHLRWMSFPHYPRSLLSPNALSIEEFEVSSGKTCLSFVFASRT
jgi:hypothetical protein